MVSLGIASLLSHSSLVQKKSKLWRFICQRWGFLNCHRTGSYLTALEAENGFPARCTRETEKRSPDCTLTSADTGLFLEKQSGNSLYLLHRNTYYMVALSGGLYCGIYYSIFLHCETVLLSWQKSLCCLGGIQQISTKQQKLLMSNAFY